jgi:plastocyanin
MPARLISLVPLLFVLAVGVACSNDEEPGPTANPNNPPALSPTQVLVQPDPVQPLDEQATEAADGVIEVTIQGAAFVGNKLRVPFGESAKIDVTNKDEQAHNLRIAGFDGEYQTEDDAVTDPDAIDAGGSGSLNFAPAVPGTYTFRCDYHPGSMGGVVIVE